MIFILSFTLRSGISVNVLRIKEVGEGNLGERSEPFIRC